MFVIWVSVFILIVKLWNQFVLFLNIIYLVFFFLFSSLLFNLPGIGVQMRHKSRGMSC